MPGRINAKDCNMSISLLASKISQIQINVFTETSRKSGNHENCGQTAKELKEFVEAYICKHLPSVMDENIQQHFDEGKFGN
jgi:hypothetical protein